MFSRYYSIYYGFMASLQCLLGATFGQLILRDGVGDIWNNVERVVQSRSEVNGAISGGSQHRNYVLHFFQYHADELHGVV